MTACPRTDGCRATGERSLREMQKETKARQKAYKKPALRKYKLVKKIGSSTIFV